MQEVANQGSITQILENEHRRLVASLTSWIGVLSSFATSSNSTTSPLLRDLPAALKTEVALSRLLKELEPYSPLQPPPHTSSSTSSTTAAVEADEEKMFLSAATKPATLCALAIELGTCEFYHCQSVGWRP